MWSYADRTVRPSDVASRRRAEQPTVVAAEVGDAFIADLERGLTGSATVLEHETLCFNETEVFLKLKGCERGQRLEVTAEG